MDNLLEIGQIVNTYGIKGFIKVVPFLDYKEQFKDFHKIYIDLNKKNEEFFIEQVKFSKDLVLLKLKGIETIEQAEMFRNQYIKIERKDIKLEEGAHFIVDLLGLEVYTEEGKVLGLTTGVSDILENPFDEITSDMKKESYDMLYNLIKKIKKSNVCTGDGVC